MKQFIKNSLLFANQHFLGTIACVSIGVICAGIFGYQQDRINTLIEQNTAMAQQTQALSGNVYTLTESNQTLQARLSTLEYMNTTNTFKVSELSATVSDYAQAQADTQNAVQAFTTGIESAAPMIQLETTWGGPVLNSYVGVVQGPSGRETYYNLNMDLCVKYMRDLGYSEEEYPVWTRDDGCKMFGKYIMCAANWSIRPKGTILETSLGWAIVVDTGTFVSEYPYGVDIATNW